MSQILKAIDAQIASYNDRIKQLQETRVAVEKLNLPDIPPEQNSCWDIMGAKQIDLNNPTRELFDTIRHCFPPGLIWKREQCSGTASMNYSTMYEGIMFRCWSTPLPPSCKVEYEETYVPGHIEKRPKIICKEEI